MKLILSIIKQLSGLKISFQRVGVYCFGKAKELEEEYKRIFGCEAGSFTLSIWTYLLIIGD
jgi:hypothetical protein